MRKFVIDIDPNEFDSFTYKQINNHYTKTAAYGKFKKNEGYDYFLVGVKDDDQLVATAMILRKRITYLFSYYCYVPYGYAMNYTDKELLSFMDAQIVKYVSDVLHACFLRIDPNICRLEHEQDGKLKNDGFNNEWLTAQLINDGFTHLGYNYGYSGNWMSRFTYVLDLSPEIELIKKHIKNFNNHTKKNQMRLIEVYEGQEEDLKILYHAQLELAKKDRFVPKPLAYFVDLYRTFGSGVHLYIAKTNLRGAYQNMLEERARLQATLIATTNSNKQKELVGGIEAISREITAMEENGYDIMGDYILGAKLIIQTGDKVFNVHMYTYKLLPNFRAALALHTKAIEESKKRDAKSYDFEGVSGSLDVKDPYYGIYDFKRSFGGEFLEFIGEFDYIIDQKKYRIYRKVDRLYRRYKRKIYLAVKGW